MIYKDAAPQALDWGARLVGNLNAFYEASNRAKV